MAAVSGPRNIVFWIYCVVWHGSTAKKEQFCNVTRWVRESILELCVHLPKYAPAHPEAKLAPMKL